MNLCNLNVDFNIMNMSTDSQLELNHKILKKTFVNNLRYFAIESYINTLQTIQKHKTMDFISS